MHVARPSRAVLLLVLLLMQQLVHPLLVSGAQEPKLVQVDPATSALTTSSIEEMVHTSHTPGSSGNHGSWRQLTAQLQPMPKPMSSAGAGGVKASSATAPQHVNDFMLAGDCLTAAACLVSSGSLYKLCVQSSECWQGLRCSWCINPQPSVLSATRP